MKRLLFILILFYIILISCSKLKLKKGVITNKYIIPKHYKTVYYYNAALKIWMPQQRFYSTKYIFIIRGKYKNKEIFERWRVSEGVYNNFELYDNVERHN